MAARPQAMKTDVLHESLMVKFDGVFKMMVVVIQKFIHRNVAIGEIGRNAAYTQWMQIRMR
ncbi:hypothetical protein [Burkholderia cenocepacia]|uniref:hypothetical protein n=1 Tax=Burkholderia cenocepacia TaxID=95486 RepID=UPI0011BDAF05|nr:hypothetical protein [Burkholderia cenocepacia]